MSPLGTVKSVVPVQASPRSAVDDEPVRGRSEWGRHARPGAGDEDASDDQGEDDERDDRDRAKRHVPPRDRRRAGRDVHREPPFGESPRGPLACASGPGEEVIDVVGLGRLTGGFEPRREVTLRVRTAGHATFPFVDRFVSTRSGTTTTRMAASARLSRDFAVPTGMPMTDAASGIDIPRK